MAQVRGALTRREREEGFTLVELLVVITIIAILAGIAIPVFLRQRTKGFQADVTSALKAASTAAQAYAVAQGGSYVGLDGDDGTLLSGQGYRPRDRVLVVVSSDDSDMCVLATHAQLPAGDAWKVATFDTSNGAPSTSDACFSVPTPAVPDPEPSEEPSSEPTVAPASTPSASAAPSATPTPTPLIVLPTLPPIDLPDCNPPVLVTLCD
jgi:type IV pilus assembly protein PilA